MIKLLAFDIDDTLTKEQATVPRENLAAIRRAQEAGIFVTIATGRAFSSFTGIWQAMGIQGPVISYGGAQINDTRTQRAIRETQLGEELVREVLELSEELGVHAHIYQQSGIVCIRDDPYARRYVGFLKHGCTIDPEICKKAWHNVPKALYMCEAERANELIPMLRERFAQRLSVSGSSPGFVEFGAPNATKGSALRWLAEEYFGLERHEVAAMGDSMLDVDMISYAGIGAAVEDAHEEAISAADVITPACIKMGAGWFIDNIVLKEGR